MKRILLLAITLITALTIHSQESTLALENETIDCCKKKSSKSDCKCADDFNKKADGYCGYIVQYDPCGNCTRIYKHNCCRIKCCRGNYKKINTNSWRQVRQVSVGAPVQFYVNNLNFLKYNFNAESSSIEIDAGDAGLIGAFITTWTGKISDVASRDKVFHTADCNKTDNYNEAKKPLDDFLEAVTPVIESFSDIYKYIDADDCESAALVNKFKKLLTEWGNLYGSQFKSDPAAYIKKQGEKIFSNYNTKAIQIIKYIKDDASCQELLVQIKKDTTAYAEINKEFKNFIDALSKVYPLPDMEYQYNVPQVKNVDYLAFKLNLKGKDDKRNARLNMKDEEIHIPVKGGVRVDFSTGPFLTFFNAKQYDLKPDTIYSASKPDSAIRAGARIIVSDDRGFIPHFGVATMLHVYPRQLPYFSVSPSFGIAVNTDLSYSFLTGCSFIMGRIQRASVNVGFSYNFVKEPSKANNVGDFVSADYSLKTVTTYKPGVFISLGYNIGLASKKNNSQKADSSDEEKKSETDKKDEKKN